MSADPVAGVVAYARSLGLSEAHLRQAALQLRDDGLTLREALARVGPGAVERVARSYPTGVRRVLEGHGDVPGFADHPLSRFTAAEGRHRADLLLSQVQDATVLRDGARGRLRAGGDRRVGRGAVEAYVRALRALGALLVDASFLATNPMISVPVPHRSGSTRDQGLTDDEVRDYLRVVLLRSRDPLLSVACWLIFRLSAARLRELLALRPADAYSSRPSLVLDGKGVQIREIPVHRPVVDLLLALDERRPGDAAQRALLRRIDGSPVTTKLFEQWSRWLHEDCDWAAGHQLRGHVLRHTTARAVERAVGHDSVDASLALGHALSSRQGTTAVYTSAPAHEHWPRRCRTIEAVFGPLFAWPDLPENDVLEGAPGLAEWMHR